MVEYGFFMSKTKQTKMKTYNTIIKRFGILSLLIATLATTLTVTAQQITEAVRYSQTTLGGTARTMGVAGAFGAVGADFGSLTINPGGLGLYRKSELVLTPNLNFSDNQTTHYDNNSTESDYGLGFSNYGVVFNVNRPSRTKTNGLVASSVALGVNQLSNFKDERFISGINTSDSFVEKLTGRANGTAVEDFESLDELVYNAWNAYLFDEHPTATNQYNSIVNGGQLRQRELKQTKGSHNEFLFGMGFNVGDRIYFGANLGVPFLSYRETTTYEEDDPNNTSERFGNLSLVEELTTFGIGFNGKFGAIGRINNNIRVGLAYHTRSLMRMNDRYSTDFAANVYNTDIGGFQEFDFSGGESTFNYRLKTPSKLIGSLVLLSQKLGGFVSMDLELVNYGKARYENLTGTFSDIEYLSSLNTDISNELNQTANIRIGAEYAKNIFRVRAGFAHLGNPLEQIGGGGTNVLTAGFGLRGKTTFIDLAFTNTDSDYQYRVYQDAFPTDVAKRNNQIAVSVGAKF